MICKIEPIFAVAIFLKVKLNRIFPAFARYSSLKKINLERPKLEKIVDCC